MLEIYAVTELTQIKALADPLRQRVLGAFCKGPATTMQVAESLGEKPHKLYHHVSILEEASLITLVETRPKRGTTEKYFEAVAKSFIIDQPLLSTQEQVGKFATEVQTLLVNAIEACLHDARNHFDTGSGASVEHSEAGMITQFRIRTSPEKRKVLIRQLLEWVRAYEAAADPNGEVEFSNLIAIFPVKE